MWGKSPVLIWERVGGLEVGLVCWDRYEERGGSLGGGSAINAGGFSLFATAQTHPAHDR